MKASVWIEGFHRLEEVKRSPELSSCYTILKKIIVLNTKDDPYLFKSVHIDSIQRVHGVLCALT